MKSNSRSRMKDPIFDAVLRAMRKKGKGFFIISCGAWIHPLNIVPNCYAILFDGSIQYKFELTKLGYKVAEIRSTAWLALDIKVGEVLTERELIAKIKEG